jgi:predicted KAP-like P-loop ATPase
MRLNSDIPISLFEEDRLNFGPLARGVARQLLTDTRPSSFVVGINGPWGSGKTSFLNLIEVAIRQESDALDDTKLPLVVRYSPWLVSNREALLRQLLPVLAADLRKRIPWYKRDLDSQSAIRELTRYANAVRAIEAGWDFATATATLFGVAVVPWLAWLPIVLNSARKALGRETAPPTLDDLRDRCRKALLRTEFRLIVIFDDLDRLDPIEVVDIARLVKSTLDLPRLTFLLAYDRPNVAACITNVLQVPGEQYT